MKSAPNKPIAHANSLPHDRDANARIILLLFAFLIAGFVGGAIWRRPKSHNSDDHAPAAVSLSASTTALLAQLREPLQIRYYALFSDDKPAEAWAQLTTNADQLLAEFERQANGKLTVTRIRNWTPENTRTAAADGVKPGNLIQGDPVYFGFAVAQARHQETIPQVSPEWSAAMEFDLARAIARVSHPPEVQPVNRSARESAFLNDAEAAVKRVIPDASSISLEDGVQKLNAASLQEFRQIVEEMNAAIEQAERALKSAEGDTGKEAALQKLRDLRASYEAKAREVAPRAKAQIEAWTRLKGK